MGYGVWGIEGSGVWVVSPTRGTQGVLGTWSRQSMGYRVSGLGLVPREHGSIVSELRVHSSIRAFKKNVFLQLVICKL